MRSIGFIFFLIAVFTIVSCTSNQENMDSNNNAVNIIFLHHSTGKTLWRGGNTFTQKVKLKLGFKSAMEKWFDNYNKKNNTNYLIKERPFPAREPYGWKNYPFDYYNIWVKNGDKAYYKNEPTLQTLTKSNQIIVLKHCFPVSKLGSGKPVNVDSDEKTIENFKAQYLALREEFLKYPNTKFLLWTPPALTERKSKEEWAQNMKVFYEWMTTEWIQPDDNIYLWDFRQLETEGGLYLKDDYAESESDSHPNTKLAQKAYPLFCNRIVEVINK